MNALRSRILTALGATLVASGTLLPARADRLPKAKESRPAAIDTARTREIVPGVRVALSLPRGEPKVGKDFDVIACIEATPAQAAAKGVTLAASMPEHAHGMLVVPVRGEGRGSPPCAVWKGLRFHMPGWWRVRVTVPVQERDAKAAAGATKSDPATTRSDARADFHFDVPPG